ncbi:MAG: polysaccharide pyruvyl transferase CsaB [Cellulosilyticaceae bacterium]
MDSKFRVVISGYYGFNNIGDEAVLKTIIESLQNEMPNVEINVLSHNPEETAKTYNTNSTNRWDLKKVFKTIKQSDLLISGGGSLLQDVTSMKTIPYYLLIVFMAQLAKKKCVFYSQGIGPVNKWHNKWLIKKVVNNVEHVFVRDEASFNLLKSIGVKTNMTQVIDPVFGIKANEEIAQKFQLEMGNGLKVGIAIRPWHNDEILIQSIKSGIEKLLEKNYNVYLIPMYYDEDLKIAKQVAEGFDTDKVHLMEEKYSIDEIVGIISCMDFIIGMRLHSLIMAIALDRPCIAISYDPKVTNIMKEMAVDNIIDVDKINGEQLKNTIEIFLSNEEKEQQKIKTAYEMRRSDLEKPVETIKTILERSRTNEKN